MGPWSRLLRIELYKSCWAGSKKLDIFCAILKQIHGMQISLLCSVPLFRVRGCFGPFWTPIPLQSYCVRISRNFSSSHGIKICPDQTLSPPREVLSILWDLHIKIINRPDFYGVFCRNQVSPGILIIFKIVRVSTHFSSSRGIQLDLSRHCPQDVLSFSWDLQTINNR